MGHVDGHERFPSFIYPQYSIVVDEEAPEDMSLLAKKVADKTVIWDDAGK